MLYPQVLFVEENEKKILKRKKNKNETKAFSVLQKSSVKRFLSHFFEVKLSTAIQLQNKKKLKKITRLVKTRGEFRKAQKLGARLFTLYVNILRYFCWV